MNHFAPHYGSQFEGFYSKFDLPSGAKLALIICSVPNAPKRPHMVSFTYVPKGAHDYFQREIWADQIDMVTTADDRSFDLRIYGIGRMSVSGNSITEYSINHDDFTFSGKTKSRTPWSTSTDTPEGPLVNLPLPLHWHVHSLASDVDFALSIPGYKHFQDSDRSGTAKAHQEKNWAQSFPSAHIWIQARSGSPPSSPSASTTKSDAKDPYRAICIAGGKILGLEAYLLGYRSSSHPHASPTKPYELDFRPPFATRALSLSPSLAIKPSFEDRTFTLSARNWFSRIDVVAKAEPNTFFPLSSPFPDGHRSNFLAESFEAEILVRVYEWQWGDRWWDVRGWWTTGADTSSPGVGKWQLMEETTFQDGSLEFGGGYYDFAGSQTRLGR